MTLTKRRILYIFFILLFFLITPLVWLYAAGYKVGSGFNIQKTGILIIDSEPKGATIYLNDKKQEDLFKKYFAGGADNIVTPYKIKNLLPREYNVRLELTGYWPWSKKLKIDAGQSTFAEDVVMFKNNLPQLILPGEFNKLYLAPNENFLIAAASSSLAIIDLANNLVSRFSPVLTNDDLLLNNIDWSSDGQKGILDHYIIDPEKQSLADLRDILGKDLEKARWNSSYNNKIFYYQNQDILEYNLSTQATTSLLTIQGLDDFISRTEILYAINNENEESFLTAWQVNGQNIIKKISIPKSKYIFLPGDHELMLLYDTTNSALHLVDPLSPIKPLRDTINNITQAKWIDGNKLLYTNEFEIWINDVSGYSRSILTRISEPIGEIFWHPTNNYIIYSTDSSISTLELDDRDRHNIMRLIQLSNIKSLEMNKQGDFLYFYARIGNQEGIYQLAIQ